MKHKKEVLKSNLYFLLETCNTESITDVKLKQHNNKQTVSRNTCYNYYCFKRKNLPVIKH